MTDFSHTGAVVMPDGIKNYSLVMIGGSNTGKSHFTFQLFGRLADKSCSLKIRQLPNLELFKEGLSQLNDGLPAEHTNADKYDNADLLIEGPDGESFEILWPDYGGEQIRLILENRGVDDAWVQRIETAEGILFFVRLTELVDYKNIVDHPLDVELGRRALLENHKEPDLSSQVGIVELLQMLLWSCRRDTTNQLTTPKLCVLLTCWDELEVSSKVPQQLLAERAPLLEQFIRATWDKGSCVVFGLSALERPLSKEKRDEEYIRKGPEAFGYVVQEDGTPTSDLTIPILTMLELLNEDHI